MELNNWYEFFFENNGLCPYCRKGLTMHVGCTNLECFLCKEIMASDRILKIRITAYNKRRQRERNYVLKRINETKKERHLDKSQKRRYAKIDD